MKPTDNCPQCEHDFGPHVFEAHMFQTIKGVEDVPVGGRIYCPVPGCECESPWSLRIPDDTTPPAA